MPSPALTVPPSVIPVAFSSFLTETDFASPDKLFTSSNFAISQTCNTTASCWSEKYRRLQDLGSIDTPGQSGYMTNVKTIVLKDGTILSVMLASKPILPDGDYAFLEFWVDVNGKAGPNIGGRDYFIYFVTNKGRIMDELQSTGNIYNEAQWLQQCKSGERRSPCVTLLQNNGWKMTY